jgi:hypothetical protein
MSSPFCRSLDHLVALSSPFCRSSDLSAALSSPSLGLKTSRCHRRCPLQVAKPPGVSAVTYFRPADITAPLAVITPFPYSTFFSTFAQFARASCWQQKAIGSLFLPEHQTGHSGRFTARGLVHERVLRRPLPQIRLDLLEACFHYPSARPIYGWRCDLLEY